MKYIKQLAVIMSITFTGELLNAILPLPVPASVYGMVILFVCLCAGVIREENIKETSDFLLLLMPLMFTAPGVGIMENFGFISDSLIAFLIVVAVTTVVIMLITGWVTQGMMQLFDKERGHE